jgi:hypothetical protein
LRFWWGNLNVEDHLKDLGTDVDFKEPGLESLDWIHFGLGEGQWWVVINMAMNLQVL